MGFKRKKFLKTFPEEAYTLVLLDKNFQSTIYNILKKLKEILYKELRKTMRMIENI